MGAHSEWKIGIKEVLGADRTRREVSALVLAELGQVHAGIAVHAVAHVDAQAPAQPAQVAEGAVVDAAPILIIKQVADVAIVACQSRLAMMAFGCSTFAAMRQHPSAFGEVWAKGWQ